MPRKTDAHNPSDWLWIVESDLELLRLASLQEVGFIAARSKLAEVLEKTMKAELLRLGWVLLKTHDLEVLFKELEQRRSGLVARFDPLVTALAEAYMLDRYPGFDIDDPDWPTLRSQVEQVTALADLVKASLVPPGTSTP